MTQSGRRAPARAFFHGVGSCEISSIFLLRTQYYILSSKLEVFGVVHCRKYCRTLGYTVSREKHVLYFVHTIICMS